MEERRNGKMEESEVGTDRRRVGDMERRSEGRGG